MDMHATLEADPVTPFEVALEWMIRLYILPFRVLSLVLVWTMMAVWRLVLGVESLAVRGIREGVTEVAEPVSWTSRPSGNAWARTISRLG
jgi:hypothetical protein